jgi:protein TonB
MSRALRPTPEVATQAVAAIATLALVWALQEHHHHHHHDRAQVADREVQLSLLPEPPAPPKLEPPKPEQPKPRMPPHEATPAPAPSVPAPAPVVVAATNATAPGELQLAAAPAPAPAPPQPSRASLENAYAAALRQNVDARTAVPDTAQYRLLRPSGATQVRFALDRIGNPSDVGIARSSGSGILDHQAVSIVASGHYPPFPETAYAGESRHVFIVTIEFRS